MKTETKVTWQFVIGFTLAAIGAVALASNADPLADYAYPIVWWGSLLIVDAWNARQRGLSLWLFDPRQFLMITVPVSVLVWLFFEALNFAAPQWHYHSRITEIWKIVLLGFASFATVIPIVVEAWWLVGGARRIPEWPARWIAQHRTTSLGVAVLVTALPLFNKIFWFNQGMWVAPMLLLVPATQAPSWWKGIRPLVTVTTAGLLAGLAWEGFNYPSPTGWQYLILPDAPHLFRMPVLGYVGFVPFALSMLTVDEWQRAIVPRAVTAATLYALALGGVYALRVAYLKYGLLNFV